MHTFRVLDDQIGLVPAAVARTLGAVDTAHGREHAFRMQRPRLLDALIDVARIQSTEASNAIERFVRDRISDEFTIADVRDASLGAGDSLIGKVLARLRDEGLIEAQGTGRSARWRRLPTG